MDDLEGSHLHAELSGVLLDSVLAVRAEPIEQEDIVATQEKAQQLDTPMKHRRSTRRRMSACVVVALLLLIGIFVWRELHADAWADVVEVVQGKPWIHGVRHGKNGDRHEFWFSPLREVSASRRGEAVQYDDHRLAIRHTFDPDAERLYRVPQTSNSEAGFQAFTTMFRGIFRGDNALTSGPPNMEIVEQNKRRVSENGREWIEYVLTLRPHDDLPDDFDRAEMVIRVDTETLLPVRMGMALLSNERSENVEFQLNYPKTGPNDVYDLGVPRSAEIVDRVPKADLARLIAGTKAGLERFDDYQALELNLVTRDSLVARDSEEQIGDLRSLPNLYRVFRKGRRWRVEWGQYRYDTEWPSAPEPDADMHEWIKGYARHHKFLPFSICDGTTIYQARLAWPEGAKFQQVDGWEVKRRLDPNRGIEQGESSESRWYRPEFYAYPTLPIGQHFDARVVAIPGTGPANSILVECSSTRGDGPDANYKARYWIDPSRSFVTMRWETESGADESRPYIMEELAQSPRGLWYPTVMRWKVGKVHEDGRPPKSDQVRHFYLDFETEMPDSLFSVGN
ncbi:MAG: hypothetical protein ACI92S_000250 [Planctomycetaceae bacterium]|jgi:hypothetical protein